MRVCEANPTGFSLPLRCESTAPSPYGDAVEVAHQSGLVLGWTSADSSHSDRLAFASVPSARLWSYGATCREVTALWRGWVGTFHSSLPCPGLSVTQTRFWVPEHRLSLGVSSTKTLCANDVPKIRHRSE